MSQEIVTTDKFGYLITSSGMQLNDQYVVLLDDLLGIGGFGKVLKAKDEVTGSEVAVKAYRNNSRTGFSMAINEIKMLQLLGTLEMEAETGFFVRMLSSFDYGSHKCVVLELLDDSLAQRLVNVQKCTGSGFMLPIVQDIARQLFQALEFLHSYNILHCDIKPDNLMFRGDKLVIIDFEVAVMTQKRSYTQTRFFRSPEVILKVPYSLPIDMWSAGCVLYQAHTAYFLFPAVNEFSMICMMTELFGNFPAALVDWMKEEKRCSFFIKTQDGSYMHKSYPRSNSLENVLHKTRGWHFVNKPGHQTEDYVKFVQLLKGCLTILPWERLTPTKALSSDFLQTNFTDKVEQINEPGPSNQQGSSNDGAGPSHEGSAQVPGPSNQSEWQSLPPYDQPGPSQDFSLRRMVSLVDVEMSSTYDDRSDSSSSTNADEVQQPPTSPRKKPYSI